VQYFIADHVLAGVFGIKRVIGLGTEAKQALGLEAVDRERLERRDEHVDANVKGVTVDQKRIVHENLNESWKIKLKSFKKIF
jgi:hypothetical protein